MPKRPQFSAEILALLKSVKAKRPRTVIDHILEHGQITTEVIRDIYGYNHPPRAIRDVRENGIPIVTSKVTGSDGRIIAAYSFGDLSEIRSKKTAGRTALSTEIKANLISIFGPICNIYLEEFPERELQVDHRIPYEIAGDQPKESVSKGARHHFMLLSPSANRAKSWSCEHCPNWKLKMEKVCQSCYWAFPEDYEHVATRSIRRLDILWSGSEISDYERLQIEAATSDMTIPEFVKSVLSSHLRDLD